MRRSFMPLVHHARRILRHRREGHPCATDAVLAGLIDELAAAYLAARNDRVARLIKVELDLLETLL